MSQLVLVEDQGMEYVKMVLPHTTRFLQTLKEVVGTFKKAIIFMLMKVSGSTGHPINPPPPPSGRVQIPYHFDQHSTGLYICPRPSPLPLPPCTGELVPEYSIDRDWAWCRLIFFTALIATTLPIRKNLISNNTDFIFGCMQSPNLWQVRKVGAFFRVQTGQFCCMRMLKTSWNFCLGISSRHFR